MTRSKLILHNDDSHICNRIYNLYLFFRCVHCIARVRYAYSIYWPIGSHSLDINYEMRGYLLFSIYLRLNELIVRRLD